VTHTFRPIGARGTTGAVIQRIATAIREAQLRVGDPLPSERALAEQLGVSRPTVRKAVRALVDAGVLSMRVGRGPNSGAVVESDVVSLDLAGGTPPAPPRIGEIAGLLEARRLFEPRVAVLAGFLMNEDDYEAMASVIELQRASVDDLAGVRRLDIRFHMALAQATHNPTVVALMQVLLERLGVARSVVSIDPDREVSDTIRVHEETLEAVASRDHDRIEAAMDEHLRLLELAWERSSGRALPRAIPQFLLSST
jgi:DNA-binding FadR family transcriptional regulator